MNGRDVQAAPPATAVAQHDRVTGLRAGQQAAVDRNDQGDGVRWRGGSVCFDEADPREALHRPVHGPPWTQAHHAWSGRERAGAELRSGEVDAICTGCRALAAAVRTATASASQVAGSSCAELMRAMSMPASIISEMSAPSAVAPPGMVTISRTRPFGGTGPNASMVWRLISSRLDVLVGAPGEPGPGSDPRWRRTASIVASTCASARPSELSPRAASSPWRCRRSCWRSAR